jgi:hypothetical protein
VLLASGQRRLSLQQREKQSRAARIWPPSVALPPRAPSSGRRGAHGGIASYLPRAVSASSGYDVCPARSDDDELQHGFHGELPHTAVSSRWNADEATGSFSDKDLRAPAGFQARSDEIRCRRGFLEDGARRPAREQATR